MEQSDSAQCLRMIARGEVDLDLIADAIRSAELVIRSCQAEAEDWKRRGEQFELRFEQEKNSADELTRRLVKLHEENRLARQIFQTEIEGKRTLTGTQSVLDLEALDMEGLIRARENAHRDLGKTLGIAGNDAAMR